MISFVSALTRHVALLCLGAALAGPALAVNDFSAAERLLFMGNPLQSLKPPLTLRYAFHKSGTLEPGFDDVVTVDLKAKPDGGCCIALPQFFTGPRRLSQPEVEGTEGNPVLLYYLEREIREMERLTTGKPNYFRKRIRMAIYQGAVVDTASFTYRGKTIAGKTVRIVPYADDPMRSRYEKLADKQYLFLLSDAVPGGLVGVRTAVAGATPGSAALFTEEMMLEGATAPATAPKP